MNLSRSAAATVAILVTTSAWAGKNQSPTASLTSPASGSTFSAPATIALSAAASDPDGTVAQVQFFQGATLLGTDTTAPYTFSWANVAAGSYSLTAKATDNGGTVKSSTAVPVTVTKPAAPIIASPSSGTAIYGNSVTVSGTYAGDPYTTTVLADNGNSSVVATLSNNNYSATLPLFRGSNTLTVHVDRMDKTYDTATVTVTGNESPFVAITSPTGDVYTAPVSLNVVASAVSPGGSISKVVWAANGATLATLTTPPYQFTWNGVVAGTYTLSATATDNNGVTATAAKAISVTAPNQAPVIGITQPASGSYFFAPASVTIAASASDPDGTVSVVQFFANGALVGASYVAPYMLHWTNVPAGTYTITAQATDNRSGRITSSPTTVTVYPSDVPPTVSLTAPADGQVLPAPANLTLSAAAADSDGLIAKVEFYRGATLLGTVQDAPYTLVWNGAPSGSYLLTAVATDNLGANTTSAAASLTVDALPAVGLISPVNGQVFNAPASITINASTSDSDGTISRVDFYQGSTLIGTATSPPYTLPWKNVPAGNYSLTAVATDNAGLFTKSAAINVVVNAPNAVPTVSLSLPTSGAEFWTPGDVTLTANAADSDGAVSKVDFFQGNTLLGTATAAPYNFVWVSPPIGTYSVTAVATDNSSASTSSSPIALTVKALQIAITAPTNFSSLSGRQVVVTGSFQGPMNSGVTINDGVAAIDSDHNFFANVPLAAGSNTLTATVHAPSGQSVSQSRAVESDGHEPLLRATVDATEGITPLTVHFSFENRHSQTVSLEVNGGSPTVVAAGATYDLSATITGAAATQFQFSESDAAGDASTQTYVITTHDPVQMDNTFTALWNGMNNALLMGDTATALTYLSGSARETYGPVFDSLMPIYSQVISNWSAPLRGELSASVAEYGVVTTDGNGAGHVYLIYFVRGSDGVWRLDSM